MTAAARSAGPRPAGVPATLGEEFILLGPEGSRAFDAAAIEAELRAMWKSAATEGATRGHPVYRAALANLIVPLDTSDLARLTPVLVEVTRRYPSRLFLIELSGTAVEAPLRARVTALCHLRPGGGGIVCSEQIVLRASPAGEPLLSSAVRSLLVGDLPAALLDIHAGAGRPWIEDLARGADLVLADSALHERVRDAEPLWEALGRAGTARVHDLAWARLLPWREVVAELFDSPEISGAITAIEEVTIEHGTGRDGEPSPPALLFAGWMAARLRWRPERRERGTLLLRSAHGPVRVAFRCVPDTGVRTVARVTIRAGSPRPLALEIEPFGREQRAGVRFTPAAGAGERRVVPFHYRDFATCIVGEIHRHEPNPVLEEAVAAARAIHGAWGRAA